MTVSRVSFVKRRVGTMTAVMNYCKQFAKKHGVNKLVIQSVQTPEMARWCLKWISAKSVSFYRNRWTGHWRLRNCMRLMYKKRRPSSEKRGGPSFFTDFHSCQTGALHSCSSWGEISWPLPHSFQWVNEENYSLLHNSFQFAASSSWCMPIQTSSIFVLSF